MLYPQQIHRISYLCCDTQRELQPFYEKEKFHKIFHYVQLNAFS